LTKSQALRNLEESLAVVIEVWIQDECMEKSWETLEFFVPHTLSVLMAASGMVCLESVVETNKFFKKEGYLK
jgi:hypothetical protein